MTTSQVETPTPAATESLATTVHFSIRSIRAPYRTDAAPLTRSVPLAQLKKSTRQGRTDRFWSAPRMDAEAVVRWADQHGLTVADDVRDLATTGWATELDALARSTATTLGQIATERAPEVEGLTSSLLEQQKVAVAAATRCHLPGPAGTEGHRGMLLADEPGLGKTVIALSVLRLRGMHCARSVVVCPTSLTANWHAEMGQHFEAGTFRPWTAQSLTPTAIPSDCDVVVVGWEILHAWVDTLLSWAPDAVVADEGHYAKADKQRTKKETEPVRDEGGAVVRDEHGNAVVRTVNKTKSGSARASAVLSLGSAVAKNHGLVLALTGTPIVNRPQELAPLLDYVGVLDLFGGRTQYKHRYCGARKVNIGGGRERWNFSGSSNLLELNARLGSSGHYVRRTKEALVDSGVLPRKYVDGVYCYDYRTNPNPWVLNLDGHALADYRAAADEATEFFTGRATEIARQLRASVDAAQVQRKVAAEGSRHLKRLSELRTLVAQAKVPYVVTKVQEIVARGEKVVIAAHHRDVVDAYAAAFSGLKIQGDMGPTRIEESKALFNETGVDEHPVMVLSVEAGKTGHTLCKQSLSGAGPACAYMVFAEQVWTPGDEAQAQDRIWRIGQDREVRIINALVATTIDEDIYRQRARKRAVVNAAVDAVDVEAMESGDRGIGRLAARFVRRGHG